MSSFLDYSQYMPHGMCYLWTPEILWTTAISDMLTTLAYFSFAAAVISFVRKRKDLPYPGFFILAGCGIFLACGLSHLFAAIVIWEPMYGHLAMIKIVVAVSSVAAGILIWKVLPLCLLIPSPTILEEKNRELQYEIQRRIDVENEIMQLNTELTKARDAALKSD
ncbi:MAG: hypothetical protein HRU20_13270 [Pseudomonadales bacterium]|nr:hypothetical protein [Pseudomonadales bacterium]